MRRQMTWQKTKETMVKMFFFYFNSVPGDGLLSLAITFAEHAGEMYPAVSFVISLGSLSRRTKLPSHIPTALTANGEAALWVPLHHRGLVVPLLMSACRSLLATKNKMLNPSKNLPPTTLRLLSRLNRETLRDAIYAMRLWWNSSLSNSH